MDIREAKYLLEIAKTKHLAKAAKNLYITQPALSKTLKKIESEFGAAIFVRNNNELLPTEIGAIILKQSEKILDEFQKLDNEINSIKNMSGNCLRVGVPEMSGFYLSDALTDFIVAHPEYRLTVHEAGGNEILVMFQQKMVDVGFLLQPINLENHNAHLVYTSEVVVGVGTEHPWAQKDHIKYSDFNDYPHASAGSHFQYYSQLEHLFAEYRVVSKPARFSKDLIGLMTYCKNAGIPCILPKPCFDYYQYASIVTRSFDPSFPWQLMCVYPQENEPNKMTRSFVQFVTRYFETVEYPIF